MLALTLATADPEAAVQAIFAESCVACHDTGDELDLTSPSAVIGKMSSETGKALVLRGNPSGSYLLQKMYGAEGIAGMSMPLGDDPLPEDQLQTVAAWIQGLETSEPANAAVAPSAPAPAGESAPLPTRKEPNPQPFHGTEQIVLPTTTTLGRNTWQYRIDHRFGRIGTERGAFGLDAGVVMSLGLAYGILDGWDVRVRRSNSRKDWEISTKYIPVRQEDGMPLSFGGYASLEVLADFDVANRVSGNFMLMASRLWFQRWSTMVTASYHLRTNHDPRVEVDLGGGPQLVRDKRDTLDVGFASTVWVGKKKRWGIDGEYFVPIPAPGRPDPFYYRGGDADPGGSKIGAWALGVSYKVGLHFFQLFLTNNRQIHLGQAAPGGQTGNPFRTPGVSSKNPFHQANFFLGFNLARKFK